MTRPRWTTLTPAIPIVVLLAGSTATPARAAVTLAEGEKGKLEMEVRFMSWAAYTGPDLPLLPGLNSAPPPAQEENIEDLFVRRLRLILRAQISQALDLYVQAGQDNIGSKILRDDAGFRIKDAALNYRKNDGLQILVGQLKVPFLRQNLCSGFDQLLVDRSFVTALRPAIEGSRDQGGMVWGNLKGFQYRAAVFDGSDQEGTNARSSLRGTARVSWNWFTPETGLSYTGTTFGQSKILQVAAQVDTQNGRLDPRDDTAFAGDPRAYRAWAAEAFYDQPLGKRWAVTGEGAWLERRDDYEAAGIATRSITGAYGQAGLLLPWSVGAGRLQVAGRWEEIETDRGAVESSLRARTFGLTWFVKGHDRKIQFDHGEVRERPVDLDDNFYRLSFVAVF